jgi:hypothetical protein
MTRAKEIARATSRPISAIRQSILGVYRPDPGMEFTFPITA